MERGKKNVIPWIIVALPVVCAMVLQAGWSFEGLYGQDAHDYLHQAKDQHAWFLGGARPEASSHPQLYPLLGAVLGLLTGDLFALRLISIGSLIAIAMIVRKELAARGGDQRIVDAYVLIALIASPFMLRQAMFAMSDLLCLLFIMLAYRMAMRFRDDGKNRRTFGVALCAGAALATRFAAAPLLIAIGAHVLISTIRQRAWKAALAGLAGKALLAVAILVVIGRAGEGSVRHPWLIDWSIRNFIARSFDTLDGYASYAWPNVVHALFPFFHPGFLLIGALLLFFVRKEDVHVRGASLALVMFALYWIFMSGMPYQNDRFLLLVQPIVAILLFPACTRAWNLLADRSALRSALMVSLLFAQIALFAYSTRTFIRLARTERELSAMLRPYADRTIYQFSLGPAIATYGFEGNVIDLWKGPIDRFDPHAVLLFNPTAFAKQWAGKNPMLNYVGAMRLRPRTIERRADGWELYELP